MDRTAVAASRAGAAGRRHAGAFVHGGHALDRDAPQPQPRAPWVVHRHVCDEAAHNQVLIEAQQTQTAALVDAWTAWRAGRAVVLALIGPTGSGVSSIASAFESAVSDADGVVTRLRPGPRLASGGMLVTE